MLLSGKRLTFYRCNRDFLLNKVVVGIKLKKSVRMEIKQVTVMANSNNSLFTPMLKLLISTCLILGG